MKEKMHIAVLSLGVCALVSMTFAVSMRDYKEKEKVPKLNSASVSSTTSKNFVCSTESVSESSQATKEYNKNIKKIEELLSKVDSLGGNTTTLEDLCEGLKGKEKTECNINNVELKSALRQVKKLEEKIIPYRECIEKLGLLKTGKEISGEIDTTKKTKKKEERNHTKTDEKVKDCGLMDQDIGEVTKESQKKLACISKAITSCSPAKITFKNSEMDDVTYIVYKKNTTSCAIGFSTNEGSSQCDIPSSIIKDLKKYGEEEGMSDFIITPIAMLVMFREGFNTETGEKITLTCRDYNSDGKKDTTGWSEGEWSDCTNGSQTRKVECLSNEKKVDEKKCARVIQPSTYQKCTITESNNDISTGKTKLYNPWVFDRLSYDVVIGDMVQFTYDLDPSMKDPNKYDFQCGKDGTRTTNPKNPNNIGSFYCIYSSIGQQTATISYQGKIVASNTFTVKEKAEQSTKKPEQKKYTCVETDAGLDYEKKGSVTGIWDFYTGDLSDPMLISTHTDMCMSNGGVLEYSCNSDGRKTSIDYMCPKGCKDGACIN